MVNDWRHGDQQHDDDEHSEGAKYGDHGGEAAHAFALQPADYGVEQVGDHARYRYGQKDWLEVGEHIADKPNESAEDGSEGADAQASEGAPEGTLLEGGRVFSAHM